MLRRLAFPILVAVAGWLLLRLIGAWPLPETFTLSLDALSAWLGPLRPLTLDAGELERARRVLYGLALAGAALLVWLEARAFRLASQRAELRDSLRETRAALESVSASFRDLVERTHDVHYRHDLTGRLEWMSEGGLRLLGYGAKDIGSLTIADLLDADHLAALRSAVQHAASPGRIGPRREVLARTRDARPLWLEVHERLIQENGVPVGIEGIAIDVTARKLTETEAAIQGEIARALAETSNLEAALRAVLEVLCRELHWQHGEVWWADDQFQLIRLAAAWSAPGSESGADDASRPRSFARGVGLPGRVWTQGETLAVPDVGGDPDPWCTRVAASSGCRRAVGIPIRLAQRVIGVVLLASARDATHWAPLPVLEALGSQIGAVTDRRRAEEALKVSEARKQAVLETALDCVITADHEGRVLEWNPAAEQAFGRSRDDALGRPLAELVVPPDLRPRHLEAFRACLETGRHPLGGARTEVDALRADGSRFAAELSIARIDVGRHPVFTAHVRDITERKAIDRLKDELVSTVSHELRTPLASIRGFVELMQMREFPAEERREFLAILEKEILRLGKLIDDFLDLQRLEASGPKYRFEPLDLREILEHAGTVVAAASEKHRLSVDLPRAPLPVRGDRDRLEQAVLNLLSNAFKYSPDGGVVELRGAQQDARVLVCVRDEGIGMAPETLERLFTKFYRADNTSTRGIGGTGLGLALVKEIATAHGGEVLATSELGRGSALTLALPLFEEESKS